MLMFTLRNLEPDGLIRRTVTPSIPPPVDYKLTELGHSLAKPVQALGLWAYHHLPEIEAAHAMYDGEKDGAS
jgi:DNA-binding HxlR family transcriptional regulator